MSNGDVIVHLDPAVGSTNIGDEIISEAVSHHLKKSFPRARIIRLGSRDIGPWSKRVVRKASYVFFGGSNALSSNPIFGYRQFCMGVLPPLALKKVILLGVGWWQYQTRFGPLARTFYKGFLHPDVVHSVRDDYTVGMVEQCGFHKVVNTGCPTMWELSSFSAKLGDGAIITLTDYNQNFERDVEMLRAVFARFSSVSFWPQGTEDVKYLSRFSMMPELARVKILAPTLQSFDEALGEGGVYVGTRLHAGIRALRHRRAAYIVPIDNRAAEIAKTESLPVVNSQLDQLLCSALFTYEAQHRSEASAFFEQFR